MAERTRCAVLDDFQSVALTNADWTPLENPFEVVGVNEHPVKEVDLVDVMADARIVVTLRERIAFRRSVFERLPHLRLLVATRYAEQCD